MTIPVPVAILLFVAAVVFNAGGLFFAFRRMKVDVDGVGRKVNRINESLATREKKFLIVFLLFCTADQREKIANLLKD
jgi:hypothetical protein